MTYKGKRPPGIASFNLISQFLYQDSSNVSHFSYPVQFSGPRAVSHFRQLTPIMTARGEGSATHAVRDDLDASMARWAVNYMKIKAGQVSYRDLPKAQSVWRKAMNDKWVHADGRTIPIARFQTQVRMVQRGNKLTTVYQMGRGGPGLLSKGRIGKYYYRIKVDSEGYTDYARRDKQDQGDAGD